MLEIDKVKIKTEETMQAFLDFLLVCLLLSPPFLSRFFFKVDQSMLAVIKNYFQL